MILNFKLGFVQKDLIFRIAVIILTITIVKQASTPINLPRVEKTDK
jgi:hypothetical protein